MGKKFSTVLFTSSSPNNFCFYNKSLNAMSEKKRYDSALPKK